MTEALNMTRRRFVQACAMAGAAAAVGVSMKGTLVEADQAWAEAPVETKIDKACSAYVLLWFPRELFCSRETESEHGGG